MRELSLHILDIITNSVEAGASRVILYINESARKNLLRIIICDNGRGMSPEMVRKVMDPFVTSRSTRPVGMGLPLLHLAATQSEGGLDVQSQEGEGTTVNAHFKLNHLNRAPLGDISATIVNLVLGAIDVHFYYLHKTDQANFHFDSYWILARAAENECTIYEMVKPAQERIKLGLKNILSKA